VGSLMVNVA